MIYKTIRRTLLGASVAAVLIVGVVPRMGALLRAQDASPESRQVEKHATGPQHRPSGDEPRRGWDGAEQSIQAHEDVALQEEGVEAARARLEEAQQRLEDAERLQSDGKGKSSGVLESRAHFKSRRAELLAARVGLQRAKRRVDRLQQDFGKSFSEDEIEGMVKKALEGLRRD